MPEGRARSELRWGVLGAGWIAWRAMLPALQTARGSRVIAVAARDPSRAARLAASHGVERVHPDYGTLLRDPEVDAVYLPLANSLHRQWTLRALDAGKHVLCEKPLALDSLEAEEMAGAARDAGKLLMEAVMYRFHPRMRELVSALAGAPIRHLYASFGFPIGAPDNYRLQPELGGGVVLDTGCYVADVARWLLGEPERVEAVVRRDAVDMSCSALLTFASGAQATLYCSFECPEYQELVVVSADRVIRVETPFTAWRDPHDPYQLMVEAFSRSALLGGPSPLPLESSIANLRVLDRMRGFTSSPRTAGGGAPGSPRNRRFRGVGEGGL